MVSTPAWLLLVVQLQCTTGSPAATLEETTEPLGVAGGTGDDVECRKIYTGGVRQESAGTARNVAGKVCRIYAMDDDGVFASRF